MDIPQMERMSKKDIISYIRECAKQYVPEWRYDERQPDAGTALVSIFADMMYDNIKKFNMSVAGDLFSFFDGVGARLYPASPAEGFVVFGLPEGFDGQAEVPRGTKLLAQTEDEQLVFETQEEVLVRPLEIGRIFLADPKADAIYDLFDKKREPVPSFFLFQGGAESLQSHRLIFCFGQELEVTSYASAQLSFLPAGRLADEGQLQEVFCDPARVRFFYGTGEGFQNITDYTYEEGKICFKIAGGERGLAPMEEFASMHVISMEIFDTEFFSRLYVRRVMLSTECLGRKPDFINVKGTDQEIEEFLAFGENPSLYDECYIGSKEVFAKAGAHICVEFDLDFVKIPLEEIAAGVKIAWKRIMRKQEFAPEEEYDITIREVIWEYYNGFGWKRLAVSGRYANLFSVEDGLKGVRRRMEFTCPADMQQVLVNSAENYCIRARIIRMNNAYKTKGAYIAPVAGNFSLSYSYQQSPLKPEIMFQQDNMELLSYPAGEINAQGFAFPMCRALAGKQKSCYIGFAQPPVGGPLKLLFVMHDSVHDSVADIKWEYLSQEGWKELHPADGTEGFMHTGMVSWYGRSDSRRETLFGEDLFWIRLSKGNEKETEDNLQNCPKVEGIYANATSILGVETVEETFGLLPFAEDKQIQLSYGDICSLQVLVLGKKDYRDSQAARWELWSEVQELSRDSGSRKEYMVDRREGKLIFPKYMEAAGKNEYGEIEVHVEYSYCRGKKGMSPSVRLTG